MKWYGEETEHTPEELSHITRCKHACDVMQERGDCEWDNFSCNECTYYDAIMEYKSLDKLTRSRVREKCSMLDVVDTADLNRRIREKKMDRLKGIALIAICFILLSVFITCVASGLVPYDSVISDTLSDNEVSLVYDIVEQTIRNVTYDNDIDCKDYTILWYLNALDYCTADNIQIVVNRNALTDMCHTFIMIYTVNGWKEIEPQDRKDFTRVWKAKYNHKYNVYNQEDYIFSFAKAEYRRLYREALCK